MDLGFKRVPLAGVWSTKYRGAWGLVCEEPLPRFRQEMGLALAGGDGDKRMGQRYILGL